MAEDSSAVFYDLDMIIRASSTGLYSASLVAETGKKLGEEVFQHFDALRDVPRALARAKSSDPSEVPSMLDKLRELGQKLHEVLLSGKVGREIRRLVDIGGQVALRLRIEPPDLAGVPWETIHDGEQFLSASSGLIISRIPLGVAKSDRPVLTTTPNLACVLVRPFLEEYGDETYWKDRKINLKRLFDEIGASGRMKVSFLEAATLDEIRELIDADNCEIIHIFSQSEDKLVLLAEGELIGADALTAELAKLRNLRMAVFTSLREQNVAISSIGLDLIAAKVPAALVMPVIMGTEQETAFLGSFYDAVGKGERLDHATSLARKAAMVINEERADFLLPVLMMTVSKPFAPPAPVAPKPQQEESAVVARLRSLVEKGQGADKALALASLALLHQKSSEYDLALDNYDLAAALFEESGDKPNFAAALNNMATILIERAEFEKAADALAKCIELRKELGAKEELVTALNKLGHVYDKLGILEKSVESYRGALDLNTELQDKVSLCDSYFSLGYAYEKMGELESAGDMLQKSVDAALALDDSERATDALEYLGAVFFDSEDYKRARETYEQCRDLRLKIGDDSALATTMNNLGNVDLRLGNLDDALKHYEKAQAIHEKAENKLGTVAGLYNLAQAQYKRGDKLEAVCYALRARKLAGEHSIAQVEYMSSTLLERIKTESGRDKYAEYLGKAQERLVGGPRWI